MFNLEESITEWRQRMLAAGIKAPVPLDELELHLREEIERQVTTGRNETEAFEMAAQTVGPAHMVQSEFEKFEESEDERKWKEGRIWSGAILGALQLILIAAVLFNSEMNFDQRLSSLAAIATSLLLVGLVGRSHRLFPVIRDRRRRLAVSFISGVVPVSLWALIAAHYFLAGHEFPFGQWLASTLWATAPPLAIYLGLIIGFETAARRRNSVVGNEVASL